MGKGKWERTDPFGFLKNSDNATGHAQCPGCGCYYTSRTGYREHIRRCASFLAKTGSIAGGANSQHAEGFEAGSVLDQDMSDSPLDQLQEEDSTLQRQMNDTFSVGQERSTEPEHYSISDGDHVQGAFTEESASDSSEKSWSGESLSEESSNAEGMDVTYENEERRNTEGLEVEDMGVDSEASEPSSVDESDATAEPMPRSAQWYRNHRNGPLYLGCSMTVMRVAFMLLSMKVTFHMQDKVVEALCKLLEFVLLPKDNHMPHSLYHLYKLCGVEPSTMVAHHCCPEDHFIWDFIPKSQWAQHKHDACPKCGKLRFVKKKGDGSGKSGYTPAKVVYYLGLERCVQHLHCLAVWKDARKEVCRDVNSKTCQTFFSTAYAKGLDAALSHKLHDLSIGLYELGTDWFSFFADKRKKLTTGAFFLRALDLPDSLKDKRFLHIPLMIIPGPREPKRIQPYVDMIIKDFERWQPGRSMGIQVRRMDSDKISQQTQNSAQLSAHWPVLASWIADGPARQKVAEMRGHAAYQACGYCWIPGRKEGQTMVFPYGFRDCVHIPPENIPTRQLQGALNVMVGSDDGEKSCQEMVTAGRKVQDGEWDKDLGGCNGLSAIIKLPYTNYKDVWLLGVAHIILLGLVPDFMKAIFPKSSSGRHLPSYAVSYENRRKIQTRQSEIHMPTGRLRPFCIIQERGSFDMAHWWLFIKYDNP